MYPATISGDVRYFWLVAVVLPVHSATLFLPTKYAFRLYTVSRAPKNSRVLRSAEHPVSGFLKRSSEWVRQIFEDRWIFKIPVHISPKTAQARGLIYRTILQPPQIAWAKGQQPRVGGNPGSYMQSGQQLSKTALQRGSVIMECTCTTVFYICETFFKAGLGSSCAQDHSKRETNRHSSHIDLLRIIQSTKQNGMQ